MKTLTLYTQNYEQALRAFLAEAVESGGLSIRNEGCREGLFYLCCAYDTQGDGIADAFTLLLEHIAVQENPVYKHSPKLAGLAQDLRGTPVHTNNVRRLRQYLRRNRTLHLEGYVAFRMSEYREKLDMMTYSLIKACLKH